MSIFETNIIIDGEIRDGAMVMPLSQLIKILLDRFSNDELIEIVMEIDDFICNLQFTKSLRDRLSIIIQQEEG